MGAKCSTLPQTTGLPVTAGIAERVFWEVETGREVEGPDLRTFLVGMTADGEEGERWRAWAEKTALGYRLAPVAS